MADEFTRALLDQMYAPKPEAPTSPSFISRLEEFLRRRQENLPTYAGTGEAAATALSGLAGMVPAGLAGLYELGKTRSPTKAAQRVEDVQEGLTYVPRTKPGLQALENLGAVMEPLSIPSEKIGQYTLEKTGSPGAATAASIALDPINLLTPGAMRAGVQGVKAAPRVARAALEQALTPGPLPGSPEAQRGAIKLKGGNWLAGDVESATEGLRASDTKYLLNRIEAIRQRGLEPTYEDLLQLQSAPINDALNNWIDKKLNRYIKNEMATPEDPIRKLAESDVLHFEPRTSSQLESDARVHRFGEGKEFGASRLARAWEDLSDLSIIPSEAKDFQSYSPIGGVKSKNPWIEKVSPETKIYELSGRTNDLGFDHLIDELKNAIRPDSDLPAHLRWKPEDLEKVTVEQAVRRVHDINQYRAAKKAEANEVLARNPATFTFKEYPTIPGSDAPNQKGLAWKEIKAPTEMEGEEFSGSLGKAYQSLSPEGQAAVREDFRKNRGRSALADALKYEGEVMGHCVGGYCDDVLSGRSKIYSLRDKKGEPHVTIEVGRNQLFLSPMDFAKSGPPSLKKRIDEADAIKRVNTQEEYEELVRNSPEYQEYLSRTSPEEIKQIKGKGNLKPKDEYLPFVQDFVRSGNWSRVGDIHNTGLITPDKVLSSETRKKLESQGIQVPNYMTEQEAKELSKQAIRASDLPTIGESLGGNKAGGAIRMAEGGEVTIPDMTDGGKVIDGGEFKKGGKVKKKVGFSDNLDTMQLELAKGGRAAIERALEVAGKKTAKEVPPPLPRAEPKTKAEIEAIAQRIAPQLLGEYVRKEPGSAITVAGKTKKQFEREKELPVELTGEVKVPAQVGIESLKDKALIGILGDPSITGRELKSVGETRLESAAPQHGGPLYGMGRENEFWASGKGAAQKVQNLAEEVAKQYGTDVLGKYIMMGPEGLNYAQHFADANLQAIDLSKMTKRQIEQFDQLVRKGSPKSGPRPSFPGIEDKEGAYLHLAFDPELRKHFNSLMQMPTVTDAFNLPSGQDIRFAITEPVLRDLERGVTGMSVGEMRPGAELTRSMHPTYEMDIPGKFIGSSKYPVPYELMFPDTVKSIRENPRQAPHEFGSLGMVGPRQIIDQQMIDEIKAYEEQIRKLTGKKKGGAVKKPKKVSISDNLDAMRLAVQKRK